LIFFVTNSWVYCKAQEIDKKLIRNMQKVESTVRKHPLIRPIII